jgi:cytoskeletal protein CcmA (bactofilin family)
MAETNRSAGARASESGAYLGPGSKANGRLLFEGPTTIEGEVEGEILVHGALTIGDNAVIKGKVSATTIVVRGKVTADIQAEKKIELQPSALVVGDLTTQALVIADGATFEGHCSMKKEKEGKVLPLLRQESGGRKSDELLVDH